MLPTRQLRGTTSTLAYLVLLHVEIARFTPPTPLARRRRTRLCCSDPHLAVDRCCLLRCPVQSGRSSSAAFRLLHQRRPGELHGRDYPPPAKRPPEGGLVKASQRVK